MTGSHFAIAASTIFDGHSPHAEGVVLIADGRIAGIAAEAPPGMPVDRFHDDIILAPGYIDAQVNGGGGVLFNATTTPEGMEAIAAAHAGTGTTSILPTLITDTPDKLATALAAARTALAADLPGIAGLHLEGPFLSQARHGAHPKSLVRRLTDDDLAALIAPFPGALLVTLAPEETTPNTIAALTDAGVIVFAGHTNATFAEAQTAFAAGLTGFTHLFNAMPGIASREPGPIAALFTNPSVRAGIIADGIHVHPANLEIALRLMGPDRLFVVSDAMPTAASDITEFDLCGDRITLKDGMLTNPSGGLAGAHITMAECVRTMVEKAGAPWDIALRMATATPADALGLSDRGRIAPGLRADLIALDRKLNVHAVWQGGVRIQ